MNEEEAVFRLGKRFSKLRNDGYDLPDEPVTVGECMVSPEELADEYDRHVPPGPPWASPEADRRFDYSLHYLGEYRMGAPEFGLSILFQDRNIDVLKEFRLFFCITHDEFRTRIRTNRSNRFDVIRGDQWTFVIDKVAETISVARAKFRIDGSTFCDEIPIAGLEHVYVEDERHSPIASTHFPFVSFDRFWDVWNDYVSFRKRQIEEAWREFGPLRLPEKGDDVSLLHDDPEQRLMAGCMVRIHEVRTDGTCVIGFDKKTAVVPCDALRVHSFSDAGNR